ncbi:uncharacterized protein Tco025E_02276, partial [Trypanosoma conorhini]
MGNCCASPTERQQPLREPLLQGPPPEASNTVEGNEWAAVTMQQNGNAPLLIKQDAMLKAVGDAPELADAGKGTGRSSVCVGPKDKADSGEQEVSMSPLTPSRCEIAEPAFGCDVSEEDFLNSAFSDSDFFTAQGSPLSLRPTLGRGVSVEPFAETDDVDMPDDPFAMSEAFMSCRSFRRIASAAANDTQLSQRLPGESGWQLPLPCRSTPLTDGASDTAFMSCRSFRRIASAAANDT